MRNKYKNILLSGLLFFGIAVLVFIKGNLSHHPEPSPQPTSPESTQATNQAANNAGPKSSTHAAQSSASLNLSKNHNYPSKILKSEPAITEIPYYLLTTSNDPSADSDWAHEKIQLDRAWDLTTGSSSTTVAVIDTGFALSHQELVNKWHTNDGETGNTQSGDRCWTGTPTDKTTNNCDDDNNGYIDDWLGYDFANNDNSPQAGEVNPTGDGTDHGTMVAGTVAAEANNNHGSSGVNQAAEIMPLQVFDDDGNAYTTDIVSAIEYATDNGAQIINLSLGSNQFDGPMQTAVQYAASHGVFVVAASGNCALNDQTFCNPLTGPGRMTYPALYSTVFAVGATASTDARADFSSYGSQLDLTAPGYSVGPMPIYTAANQVSAYAYGSGTSFSSPMVAGIASLLLAQNPSLSPSDLAYILTESANKTAGMSGANVTNEYGYGRANAHKATLLALALTESSVLGSQELSPRQSAVGHIWRATTGSVNSDESVLVGCRIFATDRCGVDVENGSNFQHMSSVEASKKGAIQFIFIPGANFIAGASTVSVSNNSQAMVVDTLTK